MPGEAVRMGAVSRILPLKAIADAIMGRFDPDSATYPSALNPLVV